MLSYFRKKKIQTTTDGSFSIPKVYAAISLGQYVRWQSATNPIQKCAAALNQTEAAIRKLVPESVVRINAAFQLVIEAETAMHVPACKLNGREYGFIPTMDEMQLGQYIDLDELSKAVFVNSDYSKLIDMMCVVYRPILSRMGNKYTIAEYTGKESEQNRKDIEQLPMSVVSGALLFFSTFELELLRSSLDYLTQVSKELETDLQST
jgi:hypothetical protein